MYQLVCDAFYDYVEVLKIIPQLDFDEKKFEIIGNNNSRRDVDILLLQLFTYLCCQGETNLKFWSFFNETAHYRIEDTVG